MPLEVPGNLQSVWNYLIEDRKVDLTDYQILLDEIEKDGNIDEKENTFLQDLTNLSGKSFLSKDGKAIQVVDFIDVPSEDIKKSNTESVSKKELMQTTIVFRKEADKVLSKPLPESKSGLEKYKKELLTLKEVGMKDFYPSKLQDLEKKISYIQSAIDNFDKLSQDTKSKVEQLLSKTLPSEENKLKELKQEFESVKESNIKKFCPDKLKEFKTKKQEIDKNLAEIQKNKGNVKKNIEEILSKASKLPEDKENLQAIYKLFENIKDSDVEKYYPDKLNDFRLIKGQVSLKLQQIERNESEVRKKLIGLINKEIPENDLESLKKLKTEFDSFDENEIQKYHNDQFKMFQLKKTSVNNALSGLQKKLEQESIEKNMVQKSLENRLPNADDNIVRDICNDPSMLKYATVSQKITMIQKLIDGGFFSYISNDDRQAVVKILESNPNDLKDIIKNYKGGISRLASIAGKGELKEQLFKLFLKSDISSDDFSKGLTGLTEYVGTGMDGGGFFDVSFVSIPINKGSIDLSEISSEKKAILANHLYLNEEYIAPFVSIDNVTVEDSVVKLIQSSNVEDLKAIDSKIKGGFITLFESIKDGKSQADTDRGAKILTHVISSYLENKDPGLRNMLDKMIRASGKEIVTKIDANIIEKLQGDALLFGMLMAKRTDS